MLKLNFVNNPRICFFAKGTEHEDGTLITPDQIPDILIPGIYDAISGYDLILSLSIFADPEYDNYVRAHIIVWDGITVSRRLYKIFGDGSSIGCADTKGKSLDKML